MLTPQEVFMHAQAALIPGKRPPATEGSFECYPCRVIRIGELGSSDDLNGLLCARHEKAVGKLMKSSFTNGTSQPQALVEQRRALLTAVVAARERRDKPRHEYTSWHSFPASFSSSSCSSADSDSGSDGAVEDEAVMVMRSVGHTPAVSLPWRGSPRLATVVESDEEEYATPRAATFTGGK